MDSSTEIINRAKAPGRKEIIVNKIGLSNFEHEIMDMLLDGNDPVLKILRKQFSSAKILSRELTGAGFFINFKVLDEIGRLPNNPTFCFGDVEASIKGLRLGASFLLFVKDGALDYLEGYTYEEDWPEEIIDYALQYFDGNERNLKNFKKEWIDKMR